MEGASLLKVAFFCFLVALTSCGFFVSFASLHVGSGLFKQTQANNIKRSFMLVGFIVNCETGVAKKCYKIFHSIFCIPLTFSGSIF